MEALGNCPVCPPLGPKSGPDVEHFATAYRSSKRVISLARQRWRRSERDKLDRRRSTKLIIPQNSDARPLWFNAEIVKLCLHAGQLATADSCYHVLVVVTFFNHNSVNCKATLILAIKIYEIKYNISLNDVHT